MTFKRLGKLFAVVWCLATEKPSWDAFDAAAQENKLLLFAHPVLASVFFPVAGLIPGVVLCCAGGIMKLFLPEFGGAVLFALSGIMLTEYIAGWRSMAVCARFIQNLCSCGGNWGAAASELSGGVEKLSGAAGTLALFIFFLIKTAAFMTLYFQNRTGLAVIFLMLPFSLQGMLALLNGVNNKPVVDGGSEGRIYVLAVTFFVVFCGAASAPVAVAAATAFCWIIYEVISRGGKALYNGIPVGWITLAGSAAEICGLFAALILIG